MLETLFEILSVDTFTFWVCVSLTFGACAILSNLTGSLGVALGFLPAVGFGGLASVYALSQAGIILVPQKDANTILSCSAGMMVGMMLMIVITRTYLFVTEIRQSVTNTLSKKEEPWHG